MTLSAPIPPDTLIQPPFALHLEIRIVSAAPNRVEAEMRASPNLMNRNGVLHGGAIMALADNVGGVAASLALPAGAMTTTLESKTNFFRSIPPSDLVRAIAVPLHQGRKTEVWQTSILRSDGKLAALVTQTQMTLPKERPPAPAT
jgi:uncharacterized protein (TIGR00369 family)